MIVRFKKTKIAFVKKRDFPVRDHFEKTLSLDEHIIKWPAATFCIRIKGDGLNDIGLFSDDILVVDRSINASDNHLIVTILEGEMVVRKLQKKGNGVYISTDGNIKNAIRITEAHDFKI